MRWYVLVHQIPPSPAYLRARIGRRLARMGSLPIKNSVYLLPHKVDCLEDFQWVAQEVEAGGGEAVVFEARFTIAGECEAAVRRLRAARHSDYQALASALRALEKTPGRARATNAAVLKLRRRLEEIRNVDFFGAPGRKEAESMMRRFEEKRTPRRKRRAGSAGDLVGRTWVTRRGVKIDRIASAWLVRRFVDPGARLRFVDPEKAHRGGRELRFDMVNGDFTHEGDRCTFETLILRAGIRDRAVAKIAEIVHDIDLKDGKFGRPETSGVQRLIDGLIASHARDADRIARGAAVFDDLYRAFGGAR